SRRRHTRFSRDWSSDVCSSDLFVLVRSILSAREVGENGYVPSSTAKLAADLVDKRAVVTGGATGIGRAIAAALTRHGVRVAIADIDPVRAEAAAAAIGGRAMAVTMDVRRRDSVQAGLDAVEAAWGGYDILAANAGV